MCYHADVEKDPLAHPKNVKFADLLRICVKYFGNPRIRGSHHIFKMPWRGDPRINIQKDGSMAKEYQVKAVLQAIERLEAEKRSAGAMGAEEEKRGKK
jgi:hypothetical protein